MIVDDDFGHITGKVLAVAMANQRIGAETYCIVCLAMLLQPVEASHPFVGFGTNVVDSILVDGLRRLAQKILDCAPKILIDVSVHPWIGRAVATRAEAHHPAVAAVGCGLNHHENLPRSCSVHEVG